jgi:hypothetical protein
VGKLSAGGGGDAPEAATEALQETSMLPWRENAVKMLKKIYYFLKKKKFISKKKNEKKFLSSKK